MRTALVLLAGLALAGCSGSSDEAKAPAAPAPPVEAPEHIVQRLYEMPHPPSTAADVESIYTADFVPGFAPATGHSPIDWDYRFDERTAQPTDFTYTVRPRSRITTRVTAHFMSHGTADSMVYELCKRADGQWRVRDIIDPDGGGSTLRPFLHLDLVRGASCPMPTGAAAVPAAAAPAAK